MKIGYLFISNSTKPSKEVLESTSPVGPSSFSKAAIMAADEMGWELHMGINRDHPEHINSIDYNIRFYNQHTYRNVFAFRDNWSAYQNLCRYLKENPQIEVIHCNTPIGGVVGRLAGKKYNKKVIYTAHGFHFFKGAPLFNLTILKWIEKWLAHYTDVLITMNQEDYEASQKFRLRKDGQVFYVPGVGIDTSSYSDGCNREIVRENLGLKKTDFVCICMGDIVERKNYRTAVESIQLINNPNVHYLICGVGPERRKLELLATKLNIQNQIHFLGYRKDMKDLLFASDCFLFSSLQEGLPRSTMEAMAVGLPCVVSDIRGNRDLIDSEKGGYLVNATDARGYADAVRKIQEDISLRTSMSEHNKEKIKDFDIKRIQKLLCGIFKQVVN